MAWESKPTIYNYFGGDIKGIIERLDYIEKLGIDFIYLNPIFYSRSTHRYDTIDYRKIDPILGTLDDFNVLVKKIHAKKLKIILDISLNHSSVDLFAFKDLLTYQEKSRYLDWYLIGEFPVSKDKANYSCWHGYSELPQFNLNNEAVQNYLIESALFWMKEFNIDGWRIDVSNELPDQFMRRFVKETKDFNQSILLIGENMHGESESFVNDAGADGITAYDLYQNIFKQYFLNDRINLIELAHNLLEYNYSHSFWAINYSWNFLSNHDIPRFFSVLEKKENYFLAFSLLLAIPGTPVLYYGEELLIDGDPENNRCSMNWDEYNIATPSFLFLQKLISIRKGYKQVFENGNIEIPFVDNYREILVVSRKFEHWNICFVLNFSEGSRTMHFEDFISTYKSYKVLLGNFSDKKEIEILNKATNIYLFEC
jgi:glycosidase